MILVRNWDGSIHCLVVFELPKIITIKDMKNVFESLTHEKKVFPLDIRELPTYLDDNLRVRREYISSTIKLKGLTAYKF